MTRAVRIGLFALFIASATGCAARSDGIYADDVRALLETKSQSVSDCWANIRRADPAAAGTVTVTFRVEESTGLISNAAVEPSRTTAPEAVSQCVVASLEGLALQPGDNRPANATYTWEL